MKMPFGLYKGKELSELPINYLEYLIGNCDFIKEPLKDAILMEIEARKGKDQNGKVASISKELLMEVFTDLSQQYPLSEEGPNRDILKGMVSLKESLEKKLP